MAGPPAPETSRSRTVTPAARSGVPSRPAASGWPCGLSAASTAVAGSAEARLARGGSGPPCRPVATACRSRWYSRPARANPASRQSPGPAASAYSNVWLQCCQAKLVPSGAVRLSPSIHTPHGQALHERISAICRVPSGLARLLGVPRLSSAAEYPARLGSPGQPAASGPARLDLRGRGQAVRGGPQRGAEVRSGQDQHRQVALAAQVRAGREGVLAGLARGQPQPAGLARGPP